VVLHLADARACRPHLRARAQIPASVLFTVCKSTHMPAQTAHVPRFAKPRRTLVDGDLQPNQTKPQRPPRVSRRLFSGRLAIATRDALRGLTASDIRTKYISINALATSNGKNPGWPPPMMT
jgi:hypothetical protein